MYWVRLEGSGSWSIEVPYRKQLERLRKIIKGISQNTPKSRQRIEVENFDK